VSEWREYLTEVLHLMSDAVIALPVQADSWKDVDLKRISEFYDEHGEQIAEYAKGGWPEPAAENAHLHQTLFEATAWLDNIRLVVERGAPDSPRDRGLVWQYIRKLRRTLEQLEGG
jgi:hypothetical protein